MPLSIKKDPLGYAITDFYNNGKANTLWVDSNITERDKINVDYLFRTFKKMPEIEKQALKLCNGTILDIGAAAGAHSYWLIKKGYDVKSIDISKMAIDIMKKRGILNTECINFFKMPANQKFDTLLFLMNGIGIANTISGLKNFFKKCNDILSINGQILLDSSNISYMFDKHYKNHRTKYFGEVEYSMQYKNIISDKFGWLFIDFDTLKKEANSNGFNCVKVLDGKHFDYLARLSK